MASSDAAERWILGPDSPDSIDSVASGRIGPRAFHEKKARALPRQQLMLSLPNLDGSLSGGDPPRPAIVKQADREVEPIQQQAARLGNGKQQQERLQSVSSIPYDRTEFVAETLLPTKTGRYRLRGYRHSADGGRTYTEPTCIMTGSPEGLRAGEPPLTAVIQKFSGDMRHLNVAVRVHDACFTSEVLGSLKCDCAEQLQLAMDYIQASEPGIIIYLQQEGRGIGLANKIAAYSLQERGLDTVDANRALGLPDDCREYTSVRNILKDLGIRSIQLMTNNPRKISVLREMGVIVTDRIPCIVKAQQFSQGYLATKQERMMHELDGSYCFWNHDGEPTGPLMSIDSETIGPFSSMDAPVATDAASIIAEKIEQSSQDPS
ncbi:hypothetical protein WJX74_003345 [Apatococcus lobatus]|uniref:GTP cyclohydrolase II n=1 Tax=Apatococcus lobatus TaxID=904363 RepID=A0AAW1R1H9_9CHLO